MSIKSTTWTGGSDKKLLKIFNIAPLMSAIFPYRNVLRKSAHFSTNQNRKKENQQHQSSSNCLISSILTSLVFFTKKNQVVKNRRKNFFFAYLICFFCVWKKIKKEYSIVYKRETYYVSLKCFDSYSDDLM